jgi:hypothetical protein
MPVLVARPRSCPIPQGGSSQRCTGMGTSGCPQEHTTALVDGRVVADLKQPGTYSLLLRDYGRGTCPHRWAVREGYRGQLGGFQNSNDVTDPDGLSSSPWNGTLDSNMMFLEAYEVALWRARQRRLAATGTPYLSTSDAHERCSARRQARVSEDPGGVEQ